MALSVVMVAISLTLAAFVLHGLFVINLERSATTDLNASLTRLVALIDPTTDTPSITGPLPDPRYEHLWEADIGRSNSSRTVLWRAHGPFSTKGLIWIRGPMARCT